MILVSDIVTKVGHLMLDPTHVRWTEAEIIGWINESAGAILTRRPAAFARRSVHTLIAGTLQSIPAGGAMLLDVVRNIGADGVKPGEAIRRTDRQLLDDSDANWHTAKPKSAVKQYTYDDRAPQIFYVYPPVVSGVKVEVLDAALPPSVSTTGDQLDLNNEYTEAVVNYVAYRCNIKDSEYASPAAAINYYQAFEASLGIKSQTQAAASPIRRPTSPSGRRLSSFASAPAHGVSRMSSTSRRTTPKACWLRPTPLFTTSTAYGLTERNCSRRAPARSTRWCRTGAPAASSLIPSPSM